MPRQVNLRQIEAFKAVIENGTISRAAEMLHISQPAMSKMIAHLEFDTGLHLFERVKGRLAPTEHAMRLHEEIDRIFSGVRQVENAIEAIRREEQARLTIGVMPALESGFIRRAMEAFQKRQPEVICSVQSQSSQRIMDGLVTRRIDVGLVGAGFDNPYILFEQLMEHPLVCIMPTAHPLTKKRVVSVSDLEGLPFVQLDKSTYIGHHVEQMLDKHKIKPDIKLVANIAPTLCEFVAGGSGVSLVHPLSVTDVRGRLQVRRFEPEILYSFGLCRSSDTRNAKLAETFAEQLKTTALEVSQTLFTDL